MRTQRQNQKSPPFKEGFFCVGVIIGGHGIKGEVIVRPFTEEPEGMVSYGTPVTLEGKAMELSGLRATKKGVIARLKDTLDRTAADQLRGTYLYVEEAGLPQTGEDEIYFQELTSMKVVNEDMSDFGVVDYVFETPANVVMEIAVEGKKDKVLLPFTEDVVLKIDHENSRIIVGEMAQQFLEL